MTAPIGGEHGICKFRIPAEHGRVLWQITNRCNYLCPYCIFESGPSKSREELSPSRALEVIDELAARGFRHLKITGGEPFVRRDLAAVIEHACRVGFTTDLSTNASRVTPDDAVRLRDSGIQMVHVSVDGPVQAVHEAARGPRTFAPTVRGLDILVRAGLRIRIGCVVFAGNEHLLSEMGEFAMAHGAEELIFSIMEPLGRLRGDRSTVTTKSETELAAIASELAKRLDGSVRVSANFGGDEPALVAIGSASARRCPGGTRFLYIDHLGRVSPCTWAVDRWPEFRSTLSLRDTALDTVLDSGPVSAYRELVREAASIGVDGCPTSWPESIREELQNTSRKRTITFCGGRGTSAAPVLPAFSREQVGTALVLPKAVSKRFLGRQVA